MPCSQCGKQFGTLQHRALPCDRCDHLFCSKCLKYKVKASKPTGKSLSVCYSCHQNILNPDPQPQPVSIDPPKILLDRLKRSGIDPTQITGKPLGAVSDNVPSASGTSSKPVDDLEERVKKLIHDVPPGDIPTIEELEARLSKLQDMKPPRVSSNVIEELSDAEKVARLVNQYTDEARIEAAMGRDDKSDEQPNVSSSDEELPWCCLCNEDAGVRCTDCDDLFCDRCFKKEHRRRPFSSHKMVRYTPKKKVRG